MVLSMNLGRAVRMAAAGAVLAATSGCGAAIQPYKGMTKEGASDPVIRAYKLDKHKVDVYIVTVTTYYQGGGASTQTYRLYQVAGFNYSLGALQDYFKESGQEKASAELGRGIRITQIAVPAVYAGGIGLVATGLGFLGGGAKDGESFSDGINWGMVVAGGVLFYGGPWLIDKITWGGYIRPAIETFNNRLKRTIEVGVAPQPGGAVAAVAVRF